MCRLSAEINANDGSQEQQQKTKKRSFLEHIWPVILIPVLLPTTQYLNRGYTYWFHLEFLCYLITRSEFLNRFLILKGASITFGWYVALVNDGYLHGRWFDILYANMPGSMRDIMYDASTGELANTDSAVRTMVGSHVLDVLGHPGLTFLLWRIHCGRGGTLRSLVTWEVVLSVYGWSRFWSLLHVYHNFGRIGFFYAGYDVYNLRNLDSWYPAYYGEGLVIAAVVVWKVFAGRNGRNEKIE